MTCLRRVRSVSLSRSSSAVLDLKLCILKVFCHFVFASNFLKLLGGHDKLIAVEIVMKISTTIWEHRTNFTFALSLTS
jgi:hypothetical protein